MEISSDLEIGQCQKFPGNIRNEIPEIREIPKVAEKYGNANVFTGPQTGNIPLHGQFDHAASDIRYGIQHSEFNSAYSQMADRVRIRCFEKFACDILAS